MRSPPPSLGCTVSAVSASPRKKDASAPYSSLWPRAILFPVNLCVSCTGESRTGPITPDVASPVPNRREGSPPWSCWQGLMQSRILLSFFDVRLHYWLMFHLSTRSSRSFSAELVSSCSASCVFCWLGLCIPRCRTAFPLVELYEIPLSQILQPVELPLNASTTIGVSSCSFQFCVWGYST